MQSDRLNWGVHSVVKKWNPEDYAGIDLKNPTEEDLVKAGIKPYEEQEVDGNLLLNAGITLMLNLLTGAGGTPYNNANARVGVGTSNVAAAATQTGLQGTNFFKQLDAGFPSVAAQTVTFRSSFGDTEANFSWQEWALDNGQVSPGTAIRLNRKVVNLGTKASGIWSLTVTITVS